MRKGFSLITVLAVLIVLSLGTAAILQAVGSHINMKHNNLQEITAQFLAEAGMQHALWKCRTSSCTSETISIDGTSVVITTSAVTNGYKIQVTVDYTTV
ncbi:MAG: hypothetical protein WC484_05230 [Candidatus Omnitrophota bacterium]